MARKKKTVQEVTPTPASIGYSGKVTVQLRNGKKTIKKATYKNSGGPSLFKYIAMCLCGSYGTALQLCPSKIALYQNGAMTPSSASFCKNILAASQLISNDSAPTIKKVTTDDETYYSVTYHFTVPYSKILSADSLSINEIVLFGTTTTQAANVETEYCAYYYLTATDPSDSSKQIWAPIVPSDYSTNFNIILDWEMTIKNQTSTVNS